MMLLENYWHGEKRSYHHTVSMSMIYALREALRVVLEEGLAARYERHELNARALLAGAKAIGLQPAAEEGYRAPMLTTLRIPDGIDDATIRKTFNYGLWDRDRGRFWVSSLERRGESG